MAIDLRRRDLLGGALTALAAAALAIPEASAQAPTAGQIYLETDLKAQAFWRAMGTRAGSGHIGAEAIYGQEVYQAGEANNPVMTDPGRAPIFYYAADPSDSTTWVRANSVSPSLLLASGADNPKNDASVELRVNAVKLSESDEHGFGRIENGSLRIDVGQAESFGPTVGTLVWTAIASIWPTVAGKLPPTPDVNFNPGTVWGGISQIPLPGGGGSLLWNFFLNKKQSMLSKVITTLQGTLPSAEVVLPLLGLPGYVLSAFVALNKILGAIPQTPTFLFQQAEWQNVACTQSNLSGMLPGTDTLRLVNGGQYIAVPTEQAASFMQQIASQRYTLNLGRIVKPTDEVPETAALNYLMDVTYATLGVAVCKGLNKCS